MVLRRLKTYQFHTKLSNPSGQIPQCAACFAELVFDGEATWQAMKSLRVCVSQERQPDQKDRTWKENSDQRTEPEAVVLYTLT